MIELIPLASIRRRQTSRIAFGGGRFYPQHYRPEHTGRYPHNAGWYNFQDKKQRDISFGAIEQAVEWLAPTFAHVVVHCCISPRVISNGKEVM